MPISISPNQLFAKKADGTGYLPANVISGETTETQCARVTAQGTTEVQRVQTKAQEVTSQLANAAEVRDMVAGTFSSSTNYTAGQIVIVTNMTTSVNELWKFTADHPAGDWIGTDAVKIKLANDVSDLKSAINGDFDYWSNVIGMPDSYIDCSAFFTEDTEAWNIEKSRTSLKATHTGTTSYGSPYCLTYLEPGRYTVHAKFSASAVNKYFKVYKGSASFSNVANNDVLIISEAATYKFICYQQEAGSFEVTDITLTKEGDNSNNFSVLLDTIMKGKTRFFLIGERYINFNFTTNKIEIPAGMLVKNNEARESLSAATINHPNAYAVLYYDMANSEFVTKTILTATDLTNMVFIAFVPETANDNVVADVPVAINDRIVNRVKASTIQPFVRQCSLLYSEFSIASRVKPIQINQRTRTIYFPSSVHVTRFGRNFIIPNANGFEFDYKGNGSYTTKCLYFKIDELENAVQNGLSNNCFYVQNDSDTSDLGENKALIAVLPDSAYLNGQRPYAIFDFVTNNETDETAIIAKGFIPTIPEVHALYGTGAPVVDTEYDQFTPYIALWDALLTKANRYGTYMQKCWIDGTPYDDTEKIMSDLPTSGDHNPRGDMNQYPLIMYKLIPTIYNESFSGKPKTKKALIVSGIHGASSGGDHLESPMAVYYLAKRLVEDFYATESLIHMRQFFEIDIIPAANPWGINNKQRVNGQNIDINRDFEDFQTVTAQNIKDLLDNGSYDFAFDSHCLGGTSLTSGDLAGANFYWFSNNSQIVGKALGKQMMDYIGAKYSLQTAQGNPTQKTSASYMAQHVNYIAAMTEIPANTPLYDGDTVGDPHGEEVMRRGTDLVQNAIAICCENIFNQMFGYLK